MKSCAAFREMFDTVIRAHLESQCESVQESEIREGCKTSSCLEEEEEHGRPKAQGCLAPNGLCHIKFAHTKNQTSLMHLSLCLSSSRNSSLVPDGSSRSCSSDLWHRICQIIQIQAQADFAWIKHSSYPVFSAWSTFLSKQDRGHCSLGWETYGRDSQELEFTK